MPNGSNCHARRVPTSSRSEAVPREERPNGPETTPASPQQQASRGAQEAQERDKGAGASKGAGAVSDTRKSGGAHKPKRHLEVVIIA
jgi:hypothetical protein